MKTVHKDQGEVFEKVSNDLELPTKPSTNSSTSHQCFLFPPSPLIIPRGENKQLLSPQQQHQTKQELKNVQQRPSTSDSPSSEQISVITFNVRFDFEGDGRNRWSFRSKGVCETLARYKMDILCLQEALQYQFDDIYAELNRNGLSYGAITRGRAQNDDCTYCPEPNEHCSILYNNEKFTKLDGGFFWLSETPDIPGTKSWDADCVRIATWIVLQLKHHDTHSDNENSTNRTKSTSDDEHQQQSHRTMSPILVVNTHWDHMGRMARLQSAKLIKNRIWEISHRFSSMNLPLHLTIFTGDLNCLSNSEEFAEMLKKQYDDVNYVTSTDVAVASADNSDGEKGEKNNPSMSLTSTTSTSPYLKFKNAKDLSSAECLFMNDRTSCGYMGVPTFTGWHDECEIIIDHVLIADHQKSFPHVHYTVLTDDLPVPSAAMKTNTNCSNHSGNNHHDRNNNTSIEVEKCECTHNSNVSNGTIDSSVPEICVTPGACTSDSESPCSPFSFKPTMMRHWTHSPMPSDEDRSPVPPPNYLRKVRRMSLPPVTSFANLEEAEQMGYLTFSRKKNRMTKRKLSDHRPILVTISI